MASMKFFSRFGLKSRENEIRIVKRFLWTPEHFGGPITRWLEYAYINERIMKIDIGGSNQWGHYAYRWVRVGFAEGVDDSTLKRD